MSLYLKYRSSTFDEIVEQDYTKNILKQQVLKSHSGESFSNYLFYGSRGIGKTSIARILAKALNCLDMKDGNPCNKCENCKLISDGKSLDIIEMDAASHTWVDNIREEIIWKAMYPPLQLKKKVYIIDEVHMLSTGAFNALLKIMEEPPSYLVFILATTELHKVPDTIASRCQVFNFKRITLKGIVQRLEYICKEEGFKYELAGLEIIARIADGGMRDAIKYLDQVSILGTIDEKTVSQCLGVTSESMIKDFISAFEAKDTKSLVNLVTQLQHDGVDIFIFLKEILNYIDYSLSPDNLRSLLWIAQFIKNTYDKLRYFPHPYVLLKAEVAALSKAQKAISNETLEEEPTNIEVTTLEAPSVKVEDKENNQNGGVGEFDELKKHIISFIPSTSIKSIWESSCHIKSVDNTTMVVQLLEKGKLILLNMPRNKQEMEKLCSEILKRSITLEYQHIDKELFLKQGLGLS
jgi:DNA polymerase III subunit gamma/tau